MSRKLLNNLDGFAVDEYAATFTGSFEVTGADAMYLAYDDEVLLVVKARVKPPRLKELKNGDIVRVNVLGVKDGAVVRSDELKNTLCTSLGLEAPLPQLSIDDALSAESPEEISSTPVDGDLEDVEVVQQPSEDAPPQVLRFRPDETPPQVSEDGPAIRTKDARLAAFLAE